MLNYDDLTKEFEQFSKSVPSDHFQKWLTEREFFEKIFNLSANKFLPTRQFYKLLWELNKFEKENGVSDMVDKARQALSEYKSETQAEISKTTSPIGKKSLMSIGELLNKTLNADAVVSTPLGTIQRDYVWSEQKKDALIDAIYEGTLEKSFIIIDYANEKPTIIIDGKQRLNVMREYNDYLESLSDRTDCLKFKRTSVFVYEIDGLNHPQTLSQMAAIFLKYNASGLPQTEEHLEIVQKIKNANI